MGNGLVEVVVLAALTIIVLPCCFFTLLALLDRFERNLDPAAQATPVLVAKPAPAAAGSTAESAAADDDTVGADVVSLPIAVTVAEAPAAATG